LRKITLAFLILALIGLGDSVYLSLSKPLNYSAYCPNSGLINCESVEGSAYSKILGIPDSVLAVAWFSLMIIIWFSNRLKFVLLPLWVLGIIFVGYFVFTEVFLIGSICLYCTLAHSVALLMGLPILKERE
jgi:Predicted membrane protein